MPTQPAILGNARLGNFRLGYESASLAAIRAARVTITLAGVFANARVRMAGFTIHDALNEAPNTCTLTVDGTAPVTGQDLRVTVNSDAPVLLFNGTLQTVDLSYEGKPTQLAWACTAVDDTARANRKRPFGTWTNISATTIAQSLVTTFAPGFTSTHVEAALPLVSITFDGSQSFSGCLASLAQLIGGYFYWEDLDLHFFLTEATDQPLDLDSTPGRFLDDPPIKAESDDSQLRTRVYGKGHGEATTADVAALETIIPIEDAVMFNLLGGQAIAGTIPDGAQSQILTYTGIQLGGVGSLVGNGATPSTAPGLTLVDGAGIEVGLHQGAYTWVTAQGETLPSPVRTVTTTAASAITDPTVAPTLETWADFTGLNRLTAVATYRYVYALHLQASGETLPSPPSDPLVLPTGTFIRVYYPKPANPYVTAYLFRSVNGGAYRRVPLSYSGHSALGDFYNDFQYSDADIAANATPPGANTAIIAAQQQVVPSGIAIGPAGTLSRNYYRTAEGSSQLKLQQTIANNSATTGVTDSTADASLGVNAPTSDTSGLTSTVLTISATFDIGVTFDTTGAATGANTAVPVFSSSQYNFVAADVGAYVYIKSGTNWTPGFYRIVSVFANAATLDRACASVASPASGTWGVDYSRLPTPRYTFTDMVIDVTNSAKFTSAANPVGGVNVIGNSMRVTGGRGFVIQTVTIVSRSAPAAIADKSLGTLSSTAGMGTLGGVALESAIAAGATSLPTSGTGPFSATGGVVAVAGGTLVRYTGLSGNSLTGIPASGSGAITTTIPYGSAVIAVPALTGVTGLALAMLKGTPVHLWVQRDDLAAQAALVLLDAAQGRTSDGVVEGQPIVDERRGEASLIALCDAQLALFSRPLVTVTYATRDTKTKSGKPIVINLTSPPITETLTIQDVQIDQIDVSPSGLAPRFTVTASSVRFSLEDVLRQLITKAAA
jgi:hypothetical protein